MRWREHVEVRHEEYVQVPQSTWKYAVQAGTEVNIAIIIIEGGAINNDRVQENLSTVQYGTFGLY